MEISSVIVRPYLTEKTQKMKDSPNPRMAFVVNPHSRKTQISEAFRRIFGIEPRAVNVMNRKPSRTRMAKGGRGYHKAFRIALVTIAKEDLQKLQQEKTDGN